MIDSIANPIKEHQAGPQDGWIIANYPLKYQTA
jgi:hypothetical protein